MPFKKLIDGYINFHKSYFQENPFIYDDLVRQGQHPEALVIACSDSRIDPAIVTTSEPGDLFVVRNVAAIVPPHENDGRSHGTSAAIEFAVKSLKIKHVIVMGHAMCGGIQALARREETRENFDFIGPWIDLGRRTLAEVNKTLPDADPAVRQRALEQAMILTSLDNLMTFPWIKDKVESGFLTLHGWYFDLRRGVLEEYDPAAKEFTDVLSYATGQRQYGHSAPCCCGDFSVSGLLRNYSLKDRKTGTG